MDLVVFTWEERGSIVLVFHTALFPPYEVDEDCHAACGETADEI